MLILRYGNGIIRKEISKGLLYSVHVAPGIPVGYKMSYVKEHIYIYIYISVYHRKSIVSFECYCCVPFIRHLNVTSNAGRCTKMISAA